MLPSAVSSRGAGVVHGEVLGEVVAVIPSSTGLEEAEDRIAGAPEWIRRSALFWGETAACAGTEEVDIEVSQVVRAGELVRAAEAAAGSGEVTESRTFSVAI